MSDNFAHLKEDSPFYSIFERGMAPIVNILVPSRVALIGDEETEAFILDWAQCSDDQKAKIATMVTTLRGGTVAEFLAYMAGGGKLPIRVSQASGTSTDSRFFLPDFPDDDLDDEDDDDDLDDDFEDDDDFDDDDFDDDDFEDDFDDDE
jgi:hypothetical protein